MDNTTASTYEVPRSRLLPTLILFLFILGLFYALFLFFSRSGLRSSIETLTEAKNATERKIEVLNDQQIQELFAAQELKNKLEEDTLRWSTVLSNLQALTPVNVFLSSYALGEDLSITLNGFGDDYDSVADLISAMESSDDFEGPFVPSVSLGTTNDGQSVVSFSMTVTLAGQ